MVYTDGIHVIADTLEELHNFAQLIGLKREWFQDNPRHPHYDTVSRKTQRAALKKGAKIRGSKELIRIIHQQQKKDHHERI